VTHPDAGHLERMLAGEMQWAMGRMLPQYHALAERLLPKALLPLEPMAPAAAVRAVAVQRSLNLGD
jgi:hypothetical protein